MFCFCYLLFSVTKTCLQVYILAFVFVDRPVQRESSGSATEVDFVPGHFWHLKYEIHCKNRNIRIISNVPGHMCPCAHVSGALLPFRQI